LPTSSPHVYELWGRNLWIETENFCSKYVPSTPPGGPFYEELQGKLRTRYHHTIRRHFDPIRGVVDLERGCPVWYTKNYTYFKQVHFGVYCYFDIEPSPGEKKAWHGNLWPYNPWIFASGVKDPRPQGERKLLEVIVEDVVNHHPQLNVEEASITLEELLSSWNFCDLFFILNQERFKEIKEQRYKHGHVVTWNFIIDESCSNDVIYHIKNASDVRVTQGYYHVVDAHEQVQVQGLEDNVTKYRIV
jgi:hypothetical protein